MAIRCSALLAFTLTALPAMGRQVDLVAWRLFEVKTLTPEVSRLKSREASLIAAGKQPVGGQRSFSRDATRRVCCQLILRDRVKGKPHRHDLVIRFFDPRGQLLGETKETLQLDGDGGMLSYLASCGSRPDSPWHLGAHRVEVVLDGAAIARRSFSILEPAKMAADRCLTDVTLAGGDRYVGESLADKFDGWGSYYWRDGTRYCGEWEAGTRHGQATMLADDGSLYVGQVRDNLCTGGLYLWPSGKVAWSRQDARGNWQNAEPLLGRVRPFNNRVWNDLAFSLDDQHVAWFHVSNLVGRPAEIVLYAAYARAQEFRRYGHLDPSLKDDRAFRQGAAATLDIQHIGEDGNLTAALERDGVPQNLRKGWDGEHVYRLHIRTPDRPGGASVVLASLTPPARVIGRAEVGDQGRSPERAQVGCFLAPGTVEPPSPKPPEDPPKPPEDRQDTREAEAEKLVEHVQRSAKPGTWLSAEAYLARLDRDYAETKYYAANRAAIDALRARVQAALKKPEPPKPPQDPREAEAESLVKDIQHTAKPGTWLSASTGLARLDREYAKTRYYAANRAAIDALRARVQAALKKPEPPKAPPIVVRGTLQPHRYCGGYIQEFERTTRPHARSYRVIESRLTKSSIAFTIDPGTRAVRGTWVFGWLYLAVVEAENGEKGEIRFNFSASGQLVGRYKAAARGGTVAGTSSGAMKIEMTVTEGGKAEKKTMAPAIGSAWAATADSKGSVTGHVIEAAAGQAAVPFVAKVIEAKDGGQ